MGNKTSTSKEEGEGDSPGPASGEMVAQMNLAVEVGGGKGWPTDATVVSYHKGQGIICVGTSGGAIYTYGDGFQYCRQWLQSDENEVTSIISVNNDKILVGFGDNSLAVLALPTLNVVDLVECTWLNSSRSGDIVTIYTDEPSERGFVYIGTSEGLLIVTECAAASGSVRVCDYSVNWNEAGLKSKMAISCIQMCPKDERYLTLVSMVQQQMKARSSSLTW